MPRDRFKTRASYDNTYKFGVYEKPVSKERNITSEQVTLMKRMYKGETVSNWEKQFISTCVKRNTLSDKQKQLLNKI